MTYDSSNRMVTYNDEEVEYDQDGNMTYGPLGGKMVHFTYDCRNRLIKAGDVSYTYDAEDIRISTSTPEYTEEYTTDSVTSLSKVLEIHRTYKNSGKNPELEVYYYGNGLLYERLYDNKEDSVDCEILVYHYDHLGSTNILTSGDGDIVSKYSYGTYGELLTTEYMDSSGKLSSEVEPDFKVRFLYNGQLGVMTDDNGLYYMRARYYNPDIKRFINQDILTGNIGNSASLNRYSYVEGNPISYTDPFGLSPYSVKLNLSPYVHTALDVLGCLPGIGVAFDITNAVLYAAEGNWGEMIRCIICAIPGMDIAGKTSKYLMKGGKIAKTLGKGLNAYTKVRNAYGLYKSAKRVGDGVAYMIDKYLVDGEEPSIQTAQEAADIMRATKGMSDYSRMVSDDFVSLLPTKPKTSQSDTKFGVVEDSMIDNIAYKPRETDFYAGDNGVARSLKEYDSYGKGGSNQLSRRELAENKLATAANGSRAEGILIGKDGDVPVYQSQKQLKDSITNAGAQYIGPTRNNDGQIYHMNTPNGPVEIRIMQQVPGQSNPYLDNRTVIVMQGSVGKGTGIYTYGNGMPITGNVPASVRKAIGHTHGQIP